MENWKKISVKYWKTMNAKRRVYHRSWGVPPQYTYVGEYPAGHSCSTIMRCFKRKSNLMIFDRHMNLKYKYDSHDFWRRGYHIDTVGRSKKAIAQCIRNQLEEDCAADQISRKEYIEPFTGSKSKSAKNSRACAAVWNSNTVLNSQRPFQGLSHYSHV